MQALPFVAVALVAAGVVVLSFSLVPVSRLTRTLPPSPVRRQWNALTALILVFIAGYLLYGALFGSRQTGSADLIVPGVFFLGALFVLLTSNLALLTAIDVRRVSLLEQENITDPLTGIHNRRYMERRLAEETARAQRYGLPLSLLLIDVDHFKRINDNLGHQAGDLIVTSLARLILQATRENDVLARYGGDELLIIAPNTRPSDAAPLAERLRHLVESSDLLAAADPDRRIQGSITVSIGIASLDADLDTPRKLVEAADASLYRAKQEGRDRVVAGGSAAERGE